MGKRGKIRVAEFPLEIMVKKYIVNLSPEERTQLEQFTTTRRHAADQITRARIILKADADQPGGSCCDEEICAALDVGVSTVERVRRRFVEKKKIGEPQNSGQNQFLLLTRYDKLWRRLKPTISM